MKRLAGIVISIAASLGLAVVAAAPADAKLTPPVPPLPESHVPCTAFATATHGMENGHGKGLETASNAVDALAYWCYHS